MKIGNYNQSQVVFREAESKTAKGETTRQSESSIRSLNSSSFTRKVAQGILFPFVLIGKMFYAIGALFQKFLPFLYYPLVQKTVNWSVTKRVLDRMVTELFTSQEDKGTRQARFLSLYEDKFPSLAKELLHKEIGCEIARHEQGMENRVGQVAWFKENESDLQQKIGGVIKGDIDSPVLKAAVANLHAEAKRNTKFIAREVA